MEGKAGDQHPLGPTPHSLAAGGLLRCAGVQVGSSDTETVTRSLKASLLDPSPLQPEREPPTPAVSSLSGVGRPRGPGVTCCLAGLGVGGAGSPAFDGGEVALVAKGWVSAGEGHSPPCWAQSRQRLCNV